MVSYHLSSFIIIVSIFGSVYSDVQTKSPVVRIKSWRRVNETSRYFSHSAGDLESPVTLDLNFKNDTVFVLPKTVASITFSCTASCPVAWIIPPEYAENNMFSKWTAHRSYLNLSDVVTYKYYMDMELSARKDKHRSSGRFSCDCVSQSRQKSLVFILWERTMPPYLLNHGKSETIYLDKNSSSVVIPCISSNLDVRVKLLKQGEVLEELNSVEYINFVGFKLLAGGNITGKYRCETEYNRNVDIEDSLDEDEDFYQVDVILKEGSKNISRVFPSTLKNFGTAAVILFDGKSNRERFLCCSNSGESPSLSVHICDQPIKCQVLQDGPFFRTHYPHRGEPYNASCAFSWFMYTMNPMLVRCSGESFDFSKMYHFSPKKPHIPVNNILFQDFMNITTNILDPKQPWRGFFPNPYVYLLVGQTVEFHCRVSSYYYAQEVFMELHWRNGSIELHEGIVADTGPYYEYSKKTEAKTAVRDLEKVVCYAPLWNTTGWVKKTIFPDIRVARKPSSSSGNSSTVTFYSNERLKTISCDLEGVPYTDFKWLGKDKKSRDMLLSRISLCNMPVPDENDCNRNLTLSWIPPKGNLSFICLASNPTGSTNKTYSIIVVDSSAPQLYSSRKENLIFYTNAINQSLNCNITSIPAPKFEWRKNDKKLSIPDDFSIHLENSGSVLLFQTVKMEFEGDYECIAGNFRGRNNKLFHVHIRDPPMKIWFVEFITTLSIMCGLGFLVTFLLCHNLTKSKKKLTLSELREFERQSSVNTLNTTITNE